MKLLFVYLFFAASLSAEEVFKKEVSVVEDNQGKACNIAFGKYRRESQAECAKVKMRVDYDSLKVSECAQEKLPDGKFKATYKIEFQCKK